MSDYITPRSGRFRINPVPSAEWFKARLQGLREQAEESDVRRTEVQDVSPPGPYGPLRRP